MSSCLGCQQLINVTDKISCFECKNNFHYACVGYTKTSFGRLAAKAKSNWKCPECKLPPKNDDNTPVKSMFDSSPPHVPLPSAAGNLDEYFRNMEVSLLSKLKTELVSLIEEKILKDIQKKVGAIPQVKAHLDEITQSLSLLSDKYDTILAENQQSREKISRLEKTVVNINNKCVYFEKCNAALEQKIHEFEQASLNDRIEIVGIEKLPGENLKDLISKVGDTINVSTSEIEWARRTTTTRLMKTSAKPAPIFIKS